MTDLNKGSNEYELENGNEEIYKDLFDNANDLIHFAKPDGTLLYVNNAWVNSLNYSNDEIKQKRIYDLIHEEDREKFYKYRNAVLGGSTEQEEITIRLKTKNGETIFIEGCVSAKLKNGTYLYTRAIFRNITQRILHQTTLHSVNDQLRQEQENLQQIIRNAPDAVIVIDENSRITLWNPKAEKIFGWKEPEVLHTLLSDKIVPAQYREAHDNGMKRYLSTGVAHVLNKTIEISAINKQGQEFFISLTISSCKIGSQTSFISFIRDITEDKKNRMELERKTQELERTNTSLEEFAYAASHDLKEPIRKVQIFSDRLKKSLEPRLGEEEKRLLERVEQANRRMSLLVGDLLEYAHLNLTPLEKEEIDLNQKVKKVLEDLELVIEEKRAEIIVEKLPLIKGYRRQIQQLFYNLISNALKYCKAEETPKVCLSGRLINGMGAGIDLSEEDLKKQYHLIEVKDNGIGFDSSYSEIIFGIFKRLHGKEEFSGTGVGLAIARKVVYNHDGFIWAESVVGQGSTFKVILPVQ